MRIALTALFCAPFLLAAGERDWTKYPAVVERPAAQTLFAIGDIHGDYERMLRLMTAARIVAAAPPKPEAASWTAGAATLVVTGDMIDKGPRPVDVLRFLIALRKDAPKHGGEVILLSGNHEAEFMAGPDPKKAADFLADLKHVGIAPADVVACRGEFGDLFCSLPFGARVGDWFFSHAGSTSGASVRDLNASIENGFAKSGFAAAELIGGSSLLEARLADGKQWFDDPNQKLSEVQFLARNAEALGVKHIVQGHQPKTVKFADGVTRNPGEMFQRWGLLFLIDTGMSRGVDDSQGAALRFAQGRAVAICPDGSETLLWSAETHADAARAAACK